MISARQIVQQLTEADTAVSAVARPKDLSWDYPDKDKVFGRQETQDGGKRIVGQSTATNVYAFGPAYPKGQPFRSLQNMISMTRRYGGLKADYIQKEGAAHPLDAAIQAGYSAVTRNTDGTVIVYAKSLPIKAPKGSAEETAKWLHIDQDKPLLLRTSSSDRTDTKVPYEKVFSEYEDDNKSEKPRLTLGVTFDKATQSKLGVVVYATADGGPMAQAGVVGGDIIAKASYSRKGKPAENALTQTNHVKTLLKIVDPGTDILFTVIRGGKSYNIPVKPVETENL